MKQKYVKVFVIKLQHFIARLQAFPRSKWEDVEVDEVDVGKFTVILHSDGARAYKLKVPGVMHCNVVHKKTKVKVNGKVRWMKPHYTKVYSLKLPTGDQIKVKCNMWKVTGKMLDTLFWES
ncbi:hypothetical protein AK812_SmicGene3590 [Symbiodinium microadriaticum]|uniref:Uncharacterized protein n=1 Tax=Symbiodinium microadriaticum TaxID=2951 RepID=A0A1Q9EYJ7_SYMMI|nr:hypothetical protein AK812_SmicGene3590 [Symbiodinium microadriaticum]